MTTTPELARPPYTYTDAQNHRLALMNTADFKDRPYVWVEAEDLAIGGDIASVWLTIEQAAALERHLDSATPGEFTDHTGDYLVTEPGELHTVVTVTRVRDEDDEPGVVRVVLLTDRLPEVRAALAATAERAQQRVTAQPETATEPAAPAVGDKYTCTTETGDRIVTVTRVWADDGGRTAVAFEWRDDKPGQCGSACPLGVFLGTYKPAAAPEPTVPAPVLSDAERTFLAFALELAGDAILDNPEDFTADDDAALASLRKLAGGES